MGKKGKSATSNVEVIKEGKATVSFSGAAFYNKAQVYNRDLSIAVITRFEELYHNEKVEKATKKALRKAEKLGNANEEAKADVERGISILEALSATGLRSVRYEKEIPHVAKIVANDIVPAAVESIRSAFNSNDCDPNVCIPNLGDANMVMYEAAAKKELFDVVDLDPYGTAAPFLNAAVQSVADGGLLCVTCTDMAVLSGNHPEACHAKYGSMPLHTKYCHEMALRIVLAAIERQANVYKRHIVPVLSCSIDFYVRVFVRVYTSAAEVKKTIRKLSTVYHCIGCDAFHFQPVGRVQITPTQRGQKERYNGELGPPVGTNCDQCGGKFRFGGPIWTDPIHDVPFVDGILEGLVESPERFHTAERMQGMLTVCAEELPNPLYYDLSQLSKIVHANQPPLINFRSALIAQGYKVSSAHANPIGIKTNAPPRAIWDVLRNWVKENPVKNISENSPGFRILQREAATDACFDRLKVADPKSRQLKFKRFPPNPEPNWGPKARAPGVGVKRKGDESPVDPSAAQAAKRLKNQGKKSKKREPKPPVCEEHIKGVCSQKGCEKYHPAKDNRHIRREQRHDRKEDE